MATTSEVKAGLDDDISSIIRTCNSKFIASKTTIQSLYNELVAIPTTFADVLSTINVYGNIDAFEALCKAEKAKLTTEFIALRDQINELITEF